MMCLRGKYHTWSGVQRTPSGQRLCSTASFSASLDVAIDVHVKHHTSQKRKNQDDNDA